MHKAKAHSKKNTDRQNLVMSSKCLSQHSQNTLCQRQALLGTRTGASLLLLLLFLVLVMVPMVVPMVVLVVVAVAVLAVVVAVVAGS